MKRVLLLRHAKSSWKDPDLDDHDRPLNKRGLRDAPRMGRVLARAGIVPDRIVSSTALRARTTAEKVAAACGSEREVQLARRLYLAEPAEMLALLRTLPDACQSVMLVGHNPGMEDLLELLTGRADTMPTAALAQVDLPVDHWRKLRPGARGALRQLWRPRELDED